MEQVDDDEPNASLEKFHRYVHRSPGRWGFNPLRPMTSSECEAFNGK